MMLAPGSPQGGQHGSGGQRGRPGGRRSEATRCAPVFTKSRVHTDVRQPIRPTDEQPRCRRRSPLRRPTEPRTATAAGVTQRRRTRGDRRPGRQRQQEDDGDCREGVDRVMQHLREKSCPEHLKAKPRAPVPAATSQQASASGHRGDGVTNRSCREHPRCVSRDQRGPSLQRGGLPPRQHRSSQSHQWTPAVQSPLLTPPGRRPACSARRAGRPGVRPLPPPQRPARAREAWHPNRVSPAGSRHDGRDMSVGPKQTSHAWARSLDSARNTASDHRGPRARPESEQAINPHGQPLNTVAHRQRQSPRPAK